MKKQSLILVASKEARHRKLFECILHCGGYIVVTAEYSQEVLEALKTVSPDLLIMDVHLNGQRSPTLTESLKADRTLCTIPVFAMTIFQEEWNEQKAQQAGYQGFIALPLHPKPFLARLDTLLREKI